MAVGAINVIVKNLIGMAERENLTLCYARKAVAMLQPSDPVSLQKATLENLANALRKATKIEEAKATAEADALEADRLAQRSCRQKPASSRREQACRRNCAAHPKEMNDPRELVTNLSMQGQTKEAIQLASRAVDASADPEFDRWATVFNKLGDELTLRLKLSEAAEWYNRATRVAKRPVDLYSASLGAGFVAAAERKDDLATRELEAAARVPGIANNEHEFAKQLLGMLVKPLDGSTPVPEASAAREWLVTGASRTPGDKSRSTEKNNSLTPE